MKHIIYVFLATVLTAATTMEIDAGLEDFFSSVPSKAVVSKFSFACGAIYTTKTKMEPTMTNRQLFQDPSWIKTRCDVFDDFIASRFPDG